MNQRLSDWHDFNNQPPGWVDYLRSLDGVDPDRITVGSQQMGRLDPAAIRMAERNDLDLRLLVSASQAVYGHTIGEQCDIEADRMFKPGDSARTLQAKRGRATNNVTRQMKEIIHGFH